MANKVFKAGDSAAITIPKQVLKEIGLAIGDEVTIAFDAKQQEIVVRPIKSTASLVSDRVARLTATFITQYRDALKKLA